MKSRLGLIISFSVLSSTVFAASVHYVDVNSLNPSPPYSSWATAASAIQDAIDVASPGDEVVVTNGNYRTGGKVVLGTITNRVAVTESLVVRSVNGPSATIIQGYQIPGLKTGPGAIRCAYVADGATLSGFTLTNGATLDNFMLGCLDLCGGGVRCEPIAVVSNCIVVNNSAHWNGGGASGGILVDCTLMGNRGMIGGGADYASLSRCALLTNSAPNGPGGGAAGCSLNDCVLIGNQANAGGAVGNCTVTNSTLVGNTAPQGGGAYYGTLVNCILSDNSSTAVGANYFGSKLFYCCAWPEASAEPGSGNFTLPPVFLDEAGGDLRLGAESPCINAGFNEAVGGLLDLAGNPRIVGGTVDLGAYEFQGPVVLVIPFIFRQTTNQTLRVGSDCELSVVAGGTRPLSYQWRFAGSNLVDATGSSLLLTNLQINQSGAYSVVITNRAGAVESSDIVLTVAPPPPPAPRYVCAASAHPTAPFTNWATAALTIQDAIDFAVAGDEIIVTNGIYQTGGRVVFGALTNRVAVTKPVSIRSVNGPAATIIEGACSPELTDSAVRCVYLASGARLQGFTLRNGSTRGFRGDEEHEGNGGGAWCENVTAVLSNCVIEGNSAYRAGGGVYRGTLYDSILTNNRAYTGGGAASSTLEDCALVQNYALWPGGANAGPGGGAASSSLNRCALAGNLASVGGGASDCEMTYCVLTNNAAYNEGGGALSSRLESCVLTANSAPRGAGSYSGSLKNCLLIRNKGGGVGGGAGAGAHSSVLTNCTLAFNEVFDTTIPPGLGGQGAGAANSSLVNCIVYFNKAVSQANYSNCQLDYCCTAPLPLTGHNIEADPGFLATSNDNFRLRPESLCIDAGSNDSVPGAADLDGRPRIVGGRIDIGAYEFDLSLSGSFLAWLQQHGLPTDGSADFSDPDHDRMNNWQEWRCGTDPADPLSVLRLLSVENGAPGLLITWQSVPGCLYFIERAVDLASPSAFLPVATDIQSSGATSYYVDAEATGTAPVFYRVGVK